MKIAFVLAVPFPVGTAFSVRALGIANVLSDCGHDVSFYGLSEINGYGQNSEMSSPNPESGTVSGFKYYNQVSKNKSNNALTKAFDWLLEGYRMIPLFSHFKPDYIILSEGYSRYLIPLLWYCQKHKIKIIVDVGDWMNYSRFKFGRFSPFAINMHLAFTIFMKKCEGVIVTSTFLEKYFLTSKVSIIRIPILIDSSKHAATNDKGSLFDENNLNLIYAGKYESKDIIDVAIYGLAILLKEGVKVKIHLVGPSEESIKYLLGERADLLEELKSSIVFHGKVAHEKVYELLKSADFSFLIRPNIRFINAGFATKFVESLNAGLPVICNLTSDMGMYVRDGENGFVMRDSSVESFVECVRRASLISEEKRLQMRQAAMAEAARSFDYRNFVNPMKEFFNNINTKV